MSDELVIAESPIEGVGLVTLNNPAKLNALSFDMLQQLDRAITSFTSDATTAAIVITGAGERAFSAGADIHQQASLLSEALEQQLEWRSDLMWRLANLSLPTIGALNGLAYGGAAVLASALDIRLGCERTQFRFLAASYGRVNSTWSLPQIVGVARAKELLFTARTIEADEGLRLGLLNNVVPSVSLVEEAIRLGAQIAENSAASVQGMKRLLHQNLGRSWVDAYRAERHLIDDTDMQPVGETFKEFLERSPRQ